MSGIIEVENLTFGYTLQSEVLENISFEVAPGTFLAIAGPNGAGKSTLLNLLCGTLKPGAGSIAIDSAPLQSYSIETLAERIAVVRQGFLPMFGFSVIETVMMARTRQFAATGFETKTDRKIVEEALQMTDTAHFAARPLGSLSTGERQRVFIARALAQDTPILLLDEPTSFLDLKHQVGIYDLLKTAQIDRGKTIVTVTHEINLAAQYCDQAMLLGADRSCLFGPAKEVLRCEQIQNVFGVNVATATAGKQQFFIALGKLAKNRPPLRDSTPNSQ
ncbi:MAG: ABC transporter ATP-binding protein [Sedimentisphaerales bacterium]|nr:ABC transporter ATP-binding protein [Sedimentisphaerales bacterium]